MEGWSGPPEARRIINRSRQAYLDSRKTEIEA